MESLPKATQPPALEMMSSSASQRHNPGEYHTVARALASGSFAPALVAWLPGSVLQRRHCTRILLFSFPAMTQVADSSPGSRMSVLHAMLATQKGMPTSTSHIRMQDGTQTTLRTQASAFSSLKVCVPICTSLDRGLPHIRLRDLSGFHHAF